ncbi:DegV family protein [[Acholeplasma] multilocale]|uniref:DegV family protein n=1 Tax=[Acholeplasma] multilocale TaxID=264638 RepID=UPI000479DB3F|nr:DegV family protein [[Acholeplasma] multilocale]
MKIGILVDSAATATPKVFNDTVVSWIPLHVTFPDNTDMLDTQELIEKNNVYSRIENGENIKTSQASPGELENKYDELLKEYDHIVHIPITANLSSMLQTAFMTANDDKYEGKVTVFQNEDMAAQGIKEVALHVSALIQNGTLTTPEQVVEEITKFKEAMYLGIIPGDLRKLSSGGRGTGVLTSVLNMFKTKVLIRWTSKPEKEAMGRTFSGVLEKVIDRVNQDYKDGYNFIFVRTPLTSVKTYMSIKGILDEAGIKYSEEFIPSIYTVHAGVETVGFIITNK